MFRLASLISFKGISFSHSLFNGNLFQSSIFFDSESILIKEIFISHSKNVVTQRKRKKCAELSGFPESSEILAGIYAGVLELADRHV